MIYIIDERFSLKSNNQSEKDTDLNNLLMRINILRDELDNKISDGHSLLDKEVYETNLELDWLIEKYLDKLKEN